MVYDSVLSKDIKKFLYLTGQYPKKRIHNGKLKQPKCIYEQFWRHCVDCAAYLEWNEMRELLCMAKCKRSGRKHSPESTAAVHTNCSHVDDIQSIFWVLQECTLCFQFLTNIWI